MTQEKLTIGSIADRAEPHHLRANFTAPEVVAVFAELERLRALNAELLGALEDCATELSGAYCGIGSIPATHSGRAAFVKARVAIAKASRVVP